MKKNIILITFLFFISFPVLAQEVIFSIDFSPNNKGFIEGDAILGYFWSEQFYSKIVYSSSSFYTDYSDLDLSFISIIKRNKFSIFPFATQNLINWNFSGGNINFSAGLLFDISIESEERYGNYQVPILGKYLFYLNQTIIYYKPLFYSELGINISPISMNFYFSKSLFDVKENLEGESFLAQSSNPYEYSANERGDELYFSGYISLKLYKEVIIVFDGFFWKHTGKGIAISYTTQYNETLYDYSVEEYNFEIYTKFKIISINIQLGVSYTNYIFNSLYEDTALLNYQSDRFSIILGFDYKL